MLVQCWTHRLRRWPSIVLTLGERLVFAGYLPNVKSMLGRRLRRWPIIASCGVCWDVVVAQSTPMQYGTTRLNLSSVVQVNGNK